MTERRIAGRLLAFALLGVVPLAACGDRDEPTAGSSSTSTTSAVTTTTTEPPTTTAPTTTSRPAPTTSTTTTPPQPAWPRRGAQGPEVEQIQRRLEELHYWVGPTDGHYGLLTEQAVYAFQKVNGLPVDGVVGPATQARLADPRPPTPQSRTGVVWEVDKTKQVLMVVRGGQVQWTWNTSTGTEKPYTHDGVQHMADTPVGHYTFTRQIDGWRHAPLGLLYRPKYFHPDGLAIHGYSNVPPYPASHGCVRVTNPAMDAIWASGLAPLGTPIWVYGVTPGS